MPEKITIFFDCHGAPTMYPMGIDEPRKCHEAWEELIDFLKEHHISYFYQDINHDQIAAEEEELLKNGAAREIAT